MKSTNPISFINQIDSANAFSAIENIKAVYHYSVPTTKLFYPEPFVASPSFMHSDLWFVHILLYQYWLWFVFIFIIVFFFITFLSTVRWCNMRVRPRRETRGVSRSKCGDLITATVPVSWATSIIVNESTDAIDYYDGFGTTELVVGIRAYQWGWEYYYPKDVDLNYNLKPNYSIFTGNSLKYVKTTDLFRESNNLWKFYQNKNSDSSVLPLFFLFSTCDNSKLLTFLNFSEIGLNPLYESNAFKRIHLFSKTFTANLSHSYTDFSLAYSFLSKQYLSQYQYLSSFSYGSKKQHNFLSKFSLLGNQLTFFSTKSFAKLIDFSFNNAIAKSNFIDFYGETPSSGITSILSFSLMFEKSFFFQFFLNFVNLDTDKKKIRNLNFKLFNPIFNSKYVYKDKNYLSQKFTTSEIASLDSSHPSDFYPVNDLKLNHRFSLISLNQNISTSEKTIRNFTKITPEQSPLNYSKTTNSTSASMGKFIANNQAVDNFALYLSSIFNNVNERTLMKISNTKLLLDYPSTPIASSKANHLSLNYDNVDKSSSKSPLILQGKEELMPSALLPAYWNFYWSNSSFESKFSNLETLNSRLNFFYLPLFTLYYDYDFRNWQSAELLEDAAWESAYPLYSHFEYFDLSKSPATESNSYSKVENAFFKTNRTNQASKLSNSSFDFKKRSYASSHFFFNDEFFVNFAAFNSQNFSLFSASQLLGLTEDAYDSTKSTSSLFIDSGKTGFLPQFSFLTNHPYSVVLDSFRSDFDDSSWSNDSAKLLGDSKLAVLHLCDIIAENPDYCLTCIVDNDPFTRTSKTARSNNSINLRNTAKSSFVTYNAMQKVFKTRFDENRSNAELSDLSGSFTQQPFITTNRTNYGALLGKTKSSFFDTLFYKNTFKNLFNTFYSIENSLNFAFYDFPFLLALKSDSSRYIWFDWFAKWGYYEVQPSSSSRYAVFGMPYFSKNFEFSTPSNEFLNESENYLIRISRSRRNYLPNWTYTPFLYLKNTLWYKQNALFSLNSLNLDNTLTELFFVLNFSSWYWTNLFFFNNTSSVFSPSNSNINSYARNASQNNFSAQGYYYLLSNLADILTKREYLYRELFFTKSKIVSLYSIFANTPKNSLFFEIKSVLNFVDIISANNEYSRDASYFALTTFKKNYFSLFLNSNFFAFFDKIILSYVTDDFANPSLYTSTLFKNQYRPMRKGVSNMIRLHATGAMALPIEIRLQVLASSKDVIHSWAIPSAGIKIDCVPGYSSHRVMIFLVSGIYWGQCMEICGRYHHWMPIVVYFMKRDLFFLWCTHFIHYNPNTAWNINDKGFIDYARVVSFDKSSWLLELNK